MKRVDIMNLSELQNGDSAVITKVKAEGEFRRRIAEMGFVKGQRVTVVKNAPLKDPIEYIIMGYEISLRRVEAAMVEVELNGSEQSFSVEPETTRFSTLQSAPSSDSAINVALIGNPNCGKTTLFNFVSGLHEHVGNYSGVTIDSKSATVKHKNYSIRFTDLPGTYSLSAYSPEELFVREHIVTQKPDIVLNIVDATNLERNLYLTTQLIDLEEKVVVALNMYDEFQQSGDVFDYQSMSEMLRTPIVPISAKRHRGIQQLLDTIVEQHSASGESRELVKISYGRVIEESIQQIESKIENSSNYPDRFIAIKLLEGDDIFAKSIASEQLVEQHKKQIKAQLGEDSQTAITDARYGFVNGALRETYKKSSKDRNQTSRAIDLILTNKFLGFPIFLGIMWLMFYCTFTIGEYPGMLLEFLVEKLQGISSSVIPEGMVNDLVTDGIIGGVGSVIIFLPNILILFLFISILEDTGYMARTAFILDRIMHKVGLHGKSFIPMVMGFGCSVPAVMAARIIENRENRVVTMFITPFMSCSAKLPVYILFLGAFFPESAGNVMFVIYLSGIVFAALTAFILNKFMFKNHTSPFVMELPPYRAPYFKNTLRHMWEKGSQYLKKMGGIILVAVVIIWVLGYFPQDQQEIIRYQEERAVVENLFDAEIASSTSPEVLIRQRDSIINVMDIEHKTVLLNSSYIAKIGHAIEPVFRPLGFDWKMSVGLTTGIAAKEVIVSTMGVINNIDADSEGGEDALQAKLRNEKFNEGARKGEYVYSKASGLSYLIFTLIYLPCIASVIAFKRESGSTKWMVLQALYSTSMAWILSYIVYNIAKLI